MKLIFAAGETCDDANAVTETCSYGESDCEVCNGSCQVVAGATSYCGDGSVDEDNGEDCDDNNAVTESCGYGAQSCGVCNSVCVTEAGATSFCGDGIVDSDHETCDDSNASTEVCNYGQTECQICNSSCQEVSGATSIAATEQQILTTRAATMGTPILRRVLMVKPHARCAIRAVKMSRVQQRSAAMG